MKKQIELFGIVFMFLAFVVMYVVFYTAFVSPTKSVTILVNHFGEGNIEAFFVLPVMALFGTFTLINKFRDYKNEK